MNRQEHLLTKLAEEACEVGQRATKALRFGLTEVHNCPNDNPEKLNNAQRIIDEVLDVFAVLELIGKEGLINLDEVPDYEPKLEAKIAKIEAMLLFSKEKGTLQ